jgi:hydrogenase maturation protein HypF
MTEKHDDMTTKNTPMDAGPRHLVRLRLTITGQVQGVGFRPFVYRTAREAGLTGAVWNDPSGVVIEVQGPEHVARNFPDLLLDRLPPLARITSLEVGEAEPVAREEGFVIATSSSGQGHSVLISPETATCADCVAEIMDPCDRRHRYPFTNCTNCGPRYTITRRIPYDRDKTSMACFPMCPACQAEYDDPMDRRFHAQPNACPRCGPRVWLAGQKGDVLARNDDALLETANLLARGAVLAVKGLGGFHLACDAGDPEAVDALRSRKNRRDKPLAVMVPDLRTARRLARVSRAEAELLTGHVRPIVLLKAEGDSPLAPAVAPDTDYIGVMLPYTPLHHVLLADFARAASGEIPALVMTSGNLSADPICLGNREALDRLSGIADAWLLHDRDILIRTDDSVVRVLPETGRTQFLRRARGYTPSPVFLAQDGPCVLGTGPELKNTLCVTKKDQAFVSQHIGDMENPATLGFFAEIAAHLPMILETGPQLVVHDLHPDYLTTRWAGSQANLPTKALQHHFAHIHAVLAENRHLGPVLGLALDGTGYGGDGTIWGGEFLVVDNQTLEHDRAGHLAHVRLPGGEAAIREPWRIAQAFLHDLGIRNGPWPWLEDFGQASRVVSQMLDKGINSPPTSSCGRLFDAVAAMLGLADTITYEGQAAIRLEHAQDTSVTDAYPLKSRKAGPMLVADTHELFAMIHGDVLNNVPARTIARRFHLGLARGLAEAAAGLAADRGLATVALSGGCLLNLTLATELPRLLGKAGLNVLTHRHLPPGDGCISLGQAAWGRRFLAAHRA